MFGMRMSISTTSGRSSAVSSDRLPPVCGLADHLDVRLRVEDHAKAAPDERLVVGEQDADHVLATSAGSRARTE